MELSEAGPLQLHPVIFDLARSSRMIRATDLCAAIGSSTEDCEIMLEGYVTRGLMRKTVASIGAVTYYWVCDEMPRDLPS